ncbi:MAG: TonB-dependent receptor [bacterium]
MKYLAFLMFIGAAMLPAQQSAIQVLDEPVLSDTVRTYHLPDVIVSATRLEKKITDVGRSVSVISRQLVSNSLYQSVGEALTMQGGLYVVGAGQNPGMIQSIFLRGAGNNQTAILIDDQRITDPASVNNALDASELSFAGVERIEIVRGSHSTLFGSSAIGGVINFITQKNRQPGLHADLSLNSGTFGSGTFSLSQNAWFNYSALEGWYVNAELSQSRVKGLDATVDSVTQSGTWNNRDRDGFSNWSATGKVGYKTDRVDAFIALIRNSSDADIDKGAYRDDDNATLAYRRSTLTYGSSYSVNDAVRLKLSGGYSRMNRSTVDDSSMTSSQGIYDHTYSSADWNGTLSNIELHAIYSIGGLKALAGIGWNKETMTAHSYLYLNSQWGLFESQSDLDPLGLNAATKSLFVHLDLNGSLLTEGLQGLEVSAGTRLNEHSRFGSQSTIEVNPSYRFNTGTMVYASYSTGFNAPSLYQLYAPDSYYTSGIRRGNEKLSPEFSATYELGVKQTLGGEVDLSLSYYQTVIDDAIEYVYLWNPAIAIDKLGTDWMRDDYRGDTYLNIGRQDIKGLELEASARITDQFLVTANAALVHGTIAYNSSSINPLESAGNYVQVYNSGEFIKGNVAAEGLVRRPNTLNVRLQYQPYSWWQLAAAVRYVGSRNDVYYESKSGPYGALGTVSVASYTLVDLMQHFTLLDQLLLNVRIENCFDVRYSEINGYTTRGRSFTLGLRYLFDPTP